MCKMWVIGLKITRLHITILQIFLIHNFLISLFSYAKKNVTLLILFWLLCLLCSLYLLCFVPAKLAHFTFHRDCWWNRNIQKKQQKDIYSILKFVTLSWSGNLCGIFRNGNLGTIFFFLIFHSFVAWFFCCSEFSLKLFFRYFSDAFEVENKNVVWKKKKSSL